MQAIKLSLEEARASSGFGAGGISQEEQVRPLDLTGCSQFSWPLCLLNRLIKLSGSVPKKFKERFMGKVKKKFKLAFFHSTNLSYYNP